MSLTPMFWFDSGPGDSAFNMALDEALLRSASRLNRPVLRFYSWTEPAASFGYSQKYAAVERMTPLRPLVRRPTGGGLVPHAADWTYALAFPAGDSWYELRAAESYRRVHTWVQAAFARLGVEVALAPASHKTRAGQCFAGHEAADVLWQGRKIAGAAQRRTRDGLLIQGSVQPPPLGLARADWQQAMRDTARLERAVHWTEFRPEAALQAQALALAAQKYSQAAYNRKR
jgi:lipoate-protein ligase A